MGGFTEKIRFIGGNDIDQFDELFCRLFFSYRLGSWSLYALHSVSARRCVAESAAIFFSGFSFVSVAMAGVLQFLSVKNVLCNVVSEYAEQSIRIKRS